MLLDTTHNIATPEGVELRLPVAGLAARTLAWLVDAVIKFFGLSLLSAILGWLGGTGQMLILLFLFATLWLYNVFFEVFNHGATPGKRALKLRVMNVNGTPVGWRGSMLRNLIRAVDALPGVYLFGCISVLLTERFQRLGDLAAGTIVVHEVRDFSAGRIGDIEPLPVRVPLSPDEQQAIVSYGERAQRINRERGEELAALLEPVLGSVDVDRLRGHASWLAGGGQT